MSRNGILTTNKLRYKLIIIRQVSDFKKLALSVLVHLCYRPTFVIQVNQDGSDYRHL